MSNITFLYERDMPTVSITRECMTYLSQKKIFSSVFCRVQDFTVDKFNDSDVLFFIRANDLTSVNIAKQAKKSGRLVVAMYDDDLLNLPDGIPLAPWRKKNIMKMLSNTDVLVSSSQYLLDKYKKKFCIKRTGKIDTIIRQDEFATNISRGKERVKIVYAAGPKHVELFNKFILPILPMLCDKYGDKISLTCVGVYPNLESYRNKMTIEVVKSMPLIEYRQYMQNQNFDIGLAPLVTNNFTKCKYFNKYLEYTIAGIAGVYSDTEPYTYVIKNNKNGFLAKDDPLDWFEKISIAIDDTVLRKNCIKNAIEHVQNSFTAEEISNRLISDIPELESGMTGKRVEKRLRSKRIIYTLYRAMDYLFLSYFYLKNSGTKGFMNNVKIHIKERGSYK